MGLSPELTKWYIDHNGKNCPYCNSTDLHADFFETDEASCWRPVECKTCGKKWDEIYLMLSIEPCT